MTASICLRTEVLYHSPSLLSSPQKEKGRDPYGKSAFLAGRAQDISAGQRVRARVMKTARAAVRMPWAIRVTRLTARRVGRSVCQ